MTITIMSSQRPIRGEIGQNAGKLTIVPFFYIHNIG
jgi:hypothetical protein